MANEMIKNLYYDYTNDRENFMNTPEYKRLTKAQRSIEKNIVEILGEDLYSDIENFIADSEAGGIEYGFIVGFKCAMILASKCAR